jgi:hypothetical protein
MPSSGSPGRRRRAPEVLDRWEATPTTEDPEVLAAQEALRSFYRRWLEGGGTIPTGCWRRSTATRTTTTATGAWATFGPGSWKRPAGTPRPSRPGRTSASAPWRTGHAAALLPVAHHEVARLAEVVGDTALAVEGYRAFIAHRAQADPELQPQVEAARARLAALTGGG